MKKIVITTCFTVSSLFVFSQNQDTLNALNTKYQKEIGVDMPFFGKNSVGFIYKKRLQNKNPQDLKSAKNLRLQIGFRGDIPFNDKVTNSDTNTVTQYSNTKFYNVNVAIGIERVKFFGRFNFYYGIDAVPYYSGISNTSYQNIPKQQNGINSETTSKRNINTIGLSVMPFVGAKYRFSEHFSASIESSFALSYFFQQTIQSTKTQYHNPPYPMPDYSSKQTSSYSGIQFSPQYLRFLSLNYHF